MKLSIVGIYLAASSALSVAYPTSELVYDRADNDIVAVTARAIWGQGKYSVDEGVYHTQIKPHLKAAFASHYSKFVSFCGSNPDFYCDRKGMVTASAADSKKKATCNKSNFPALDLGDSLVLPHIQRRSYVDIFDDLD